MKTASFGNLSLRSRLRRRGAWWSGAGILVAGVAAVWFCRESPLERALDRLLTAPLIIWRAPPETFDNFSDRELVAGMALVLRSETNCVPYLCRELRRDNCRCCTRYA